MNPLRTLATVCIAVCCASTADADPIVITAPCVDDAAKTCTTGIDSLSLGDKVFNVDFVIGSYDSVFTGEDPFFLGDLTSATAMADLIADVLNSIGTIFGAIGDGVFSAILIPAGISDNNGILGSFGPCAAATIVDSAEWTSLCGYGANHDANPSSNVVFQPYAVITDCTFPGGGATGGCFPGPGPFPAPEPGTLALLGIGLLGMGAARRKKA